MKKTVLAIGLVLALSLSVAAASFEFYGGGSYNTFDPKALNDLGKAGNTWLETKAPTKTGDVTEVDVTKFEDIKSGFGAFGGVRYWINPTMAIGGEIEYFGAKSEGGVEVKATGDSDSKEGSLDASINTSVTGFSGAGAFKASPELTVFASAGYYYLNGDVEITLDDDTGTISDGFGDPGDFKGGKSKFNDSALGFKAGVAYAYPVADELSILGRIGYRSLKFDEVEFDDDEKYGLEEEVSELAALADKEIDFSGLEVGLGIVYSF